MAIRIGVNVHLNDLGCSTNLDSAERPHGLEHDQAAIGPACKVTEFCVSLGDDDLKRSAS
jgi:hypothetical protein